MGGEGHGHHTLHKDNNSSKRVASKDLKCLIASLAYVCMYIHCDCSCVCIKMDSVVSCMGSLLTWKMYTEMSDPHNYDQNMLQRKHL